MAGDSESALTHSSTTTGAFLRENQDNIESKWAVIDHDLLCQLTKINFSAGAGESVIWAEKRGQEIQEVH